MEREEVENILIEILIEIQEEIGEDIEEIDAFTCPVGGISCFDSLVGVLVTARCFERFDIKDKKTVSLFESKKYSEPLTIRDVADRIIILKKDGVIKNVGPY